MKFNRYELFGILASILLVVAVLSAVRFLPYESADADTEKPSDIIVVKANAANSQAALANALIEASDSRGRVRSLVVQDTVMGSGREVRAGDTISINYTGVVQGGVQFASTYDTSEPFSFQVGAGDAIEGLERGVIGMKEGGQRILVVPASMAYGKRSVGPVPANASLLFSIALLTIE